MERLEAHVVPSESERVWSEDLERSSRLGLYDVDFALGKPRKVEIV